MTTFTTESIFPEGNMRRLICAALAIVGAVTLAVLPAGPASAHNGYHYVWLVGSMSITDQDWPDSDDYGWVDISRDVTLSPTTAIQTVQIEGCADEVRVILDVYVQHDPNMLSAGVLVTTRTRLYEGASCSTTDLEASASRQFAAPGQGWGSDQWTVNASGNKTSILLEARNLIS